MSSSVFANNLGADHRASSGAYYATDQRWQAIIKPKIRIRLRRFINSGKLSHHRSHPSVVTAKTRRKLQINEILFLGIFFAALHSPALDPQVQAENPRQTSSPKASVDAQLSAKLLSDFRFSINEKPLREALNSLAASAHINLWLDRRIDPTTLITTGAEARTLYQAIAASVLSAGAAVGVADNIILVGRKAWVEQVAGAILASPPSPSPQEIVWNDLTTPTLAAQFCVSGSRQPLPHDLWPAVRWTKIDPAVALLLVAAQFDMMPSPDTVDAYTPLAVPAVISAHYPLGSHSKAMRAAISKADANAKVKEVNSRLVVSGNAAAHHAATAAWLGETAQAPTKILDIDKVRFSIDLKNAIASQVFAQLSATAGRQLVINPDAVERCKQKVSLSTKDATLRDVSESIAKAADLELSWSDSELQVRSKN